VAREGPLLTRPPFPLEQLVIDSRAVRAAPGVLAAAGVAGGATYDGLVALAARSAGLPLATRDRRAQGTYRLLDVSIEMLV